MKKYIAPQIKAIELPDDIACQYSREPHQPDDHHHHHHWDYPDEPGPDQPEDWYKINE